MPIFEYVCEDCEAPFEELVFSTNGAPDVACPDCGSVQVEKQISTFASRISGDGSDLMSARVAAACNPGSV